MVNSVMAALFVALVLASGCLAGTGVAPTSTDASGARPIGPGSPTPLPSSPARPAPVPSTHDGPTSPAPTPASTTPNPGTPTSNPSVHFGPPTGIPGDANLASVNVARSGDTLAACRATPHYAGQGPAARFFITRNATGWAEVLQPTGPTDARNAFTNRGNDCDVAAGPDGSWYATDGWDAGFEVMSSGDGGLTWSLVTAAAGSLPAGPTGTTGRPIYVRPWLATGPGRTVHLVYRSFQDAVGRESNGIYYTRSDDGGAHFTAPVAAVTSHPGESTPNVPGNLAVSSDGLHLAFGYDLQGYGPPPTDALAVATSGDGGKTWLSTRIGAWGTMADDSVARIAAGPDGLLHLVDTELGNGIPHVMYRSSGDQGATWSAPLNLTADGYGVAASVVADRAGAAAVTWYGMSPDGNGSAAGQPDRYLVWARLVSDGAQPGKMRFHTGLVDPALRPPGERRPLVGNILLDAAGRMIVAWPGSALADGTSFHAFVQRQDAGPTLGSGV